MTVGPIRLVQVDMARFGGSDYRLSKLGEGHTWYHLTLKKWFKWQFQ